MEKDSYAIGVLMVMNTELKKEQKFYVMKVLMTYILKVMDTT